MSTKSLCTSLSLGLAVATISCSGPPANDAASDSVCYRGVRMDAVRVDGELLVEGDIIVMPEDLWCDHEEQLSAEINRAQQAVRRQGAERRWPGGAVAYRFDESFSAAEDQADALSAMRTWEALVPSLKFVPADETGAADFIRFRKSSRCSSPVGRHANANNINLADGCLGPGNFSVHHEIGHALGLYHQHTRKDRDQFINVNWSNIKGCPSSATSASDCGPSRCDSNLADCGCTTIDVENGACYMYTNFGSDAARADIGAYDYDSIMHYGRRAFSKAGAGDTLEVLLNDDSGTPFAIGQRNHLSEGDLLAMRAMYPAVTIPSTIFSGSGTQPVCSLEGREHDVAVRFDMTGSSPQLTTEIVDRALGVGDFSVNCAVSSTFWADNYDYPNADVPFDPALEAEEYTASRTLRVLPIGLVPAVL